jgi:large subunit ribosomal protein L17
MRFAMTARTLARQRGEGRTTEMTERNVEKVTRFRPNGEEELEAMVERLNDLKLGDREVDIRKKPRSGQKVEDEEEKKKKK